MRLSKHYVFGLGTGRCGTVSLAAVLNTAQGADISHEFVPLDKQGQLMEIMRTAEPLPWIVNRPKLRRVLRGLERRDSPIVGDVGSYWLPYVDDLVHRLNGDCRFICLWRPKDEVISSFLRVVGERNHWVDHGGTTWEASPRWDPVFPTYPEMVMESALAFYWHEYDGRSRELQRKYPDCFRIWSMTEALNTSQGLTEVYEFAGVSGDLKAKGTRENRGDSHA